MCQFHLCGTEKVYFMIDISQTNVFGLSHQYIKKYKNDNVKLVLEIRFDRKNIYFYKIHMILFSYFGNHIYKKNLVINFIKKMASSEMLSTHELRILISIFFLLLDLLSDHKLIKVILCIDTAYKT